MYSVIYILIAFLVALAVGVWTYRQTKSNDNFDYVPAIAAGFLWPMYLTFMLAVKILDGFKALCIHISNGMDEAEEQRLEKEANSKEP